MKHKDWAFGKVVLEEQEQELAHIAVDWVRRLVLDMAVALEQDMAEELEPVHTVKRKI